MNDINKIKDNIDKIWKQKHILDDNKQLIESVISFIDSGKIRVCQKVDENWVVNQWVKKAILLYFMLRPTEKISFGEFEFYDKIPIKKDYDKKGIRSVPMAVSRYGSYISKRVVLMPSYVNIGAYVDEGTMVDTWATIGSCAQVGKNVHVSGGVGLGGVLEPIQANPVIIEDNVFLGSRSIIVEGVIIKKEAVLGANVVITSSTKIIDVTGNQPLEIKGYVPQRSVVIPGTYQKRFNAGTYGVNCALIIGKRKQSTDKKTSLNDVLRDFNISV